MLKHVSISPWRGRSDSVSLASSGGASSCGSGSPSPGHTPPPSRASSCASLAPLTGLSSFSPADAAPQQTTIKVYANCLRPDIEYKTLCITYETTCREVVQNLLNKYRMRHRDPRLFYLTMEVTVRRANVRTILPLDEDSRPAVLQSCHPRGDSRFSLQTRRGGLVKIYDSALMSGSKYKSLLVSEKTTVDELIQILLSCYSSNERVEQFSLYEVSEGEEYQRKLHPDDVPLKVTQRWTSVDRHLRIRRNPDYNPQRRKSMWASDSSIALAMSRLQLQDPLHHHHFFSQNNNHLAHRHNHVHNRNNHHHHHHHHSSHHHSHCHCAKSDKNNNNSSSSSSSSNNIQNNNNNHNNHNNNNNNANVAKQNGQNLPIAKPPQQQQKQKQQSRLVPHSAQLPTKLQLQQTLKSLPSTPLATKHISTSNYAEYENYLFI